MAAHATAANAANSDQQQAAALCFVARQPILDVHGKARGYQLLCWDGRPPMPGAVSGLATAAISNAAGICGLEQLARGLPAFLRCAPDSLAEEWLQSFTPGTTVLELPTAVEATPALLAACGELKASGFRMALTCFTGTQGSWPLAELADYIKIDIAGVDAATRQNLLRALESLPASRVASHVENQEQYAEARKQGFELFQGYYFCHQEPVTSHRIPGNRLVHLEILEDLQNDPVDLNRLSQLVMCDAGLTYRLLRLVNSPLCAVRQEVTSIRSALMLIGESAFRRMAMLAIASDFAGDQSPEILRLAIERGRFCELAAGLCGLAPGEQYIIGMVSLFPALLRVPIDDLVRALPLRASARDALLGNSIREGILLRWREAEESGDWAGCDRILPCNGLDRRQLMRCQADAMAWADAAIK